MEESDSSSHDAKQEDVTGENVENENEDTHKQVEAESDIGLSDDEMDMLANIMESEG